jgi:hypothetical protein
MNARAPYLMAGQSKKIEENGGGTIVVRATHLLRIHFCILQAVLWARCLYKVKVLFAAGCLDGTVIPT